MVFNEGMNRHSICEEIVLRKGGRFDDPLMS